MFICYIKPYGIDLFQFISLKYLGDENKFCQREIPWCTMHSCSKNVRKNGKGFDVRVKVSRLHELHVEF